MKFKYPTSAFQVLHVVLSVYAVLSLVTQTTNGRTTKNPAGIWNERIRDEGGFVYLEHMRKAGGSTLQEIIRKALVHHNNSRVWFVHNEWTPMDPHCPQADAERWNRTISLVAVREPLERHISEFYYAGLGRKILNKIDVDSKKYLSERGTLPPLTMNTSVIPALLEWLSNAEESRVVRGTYIKNFQVKHLVSGAGLPRSRPTDLLQDLSQPFPLHGHLSWPHAPDQPKIRNVGKPVHCNSNTPVLLSSSELRRMHLLLAEEALGTFDIVIPTESLHDNTQERLIAAILNVSTTAIGMASPTEDLKPVRQTRRASSSLYRQTIAALPEDIRRQFIADNKFDFALYTHALTLSTEFERAFAIEQT